MNMSVYHSDFNGGYCYINGSNGSVIRNHNSIDYKNNVDDISTNKYWRGNNGLPGGVDIDKMLPESSPNQCDIMEFNNEPYNLQINGKI